MEYLTASQAAQALGFEHPETLADLRNAGFLEACIPDLGPRYSWREVERLLVTGTQISPLRAAGKIAAAIWPEDGNYSCIEQ